MAGKATFYSAPLLIASHAVPGEITFDCAVALVCLPHNTIKDCQSSVVTIGANCCMHNHILSPCHRLLNAYCWVVWIFNHIVELGNQTLFRLTVATYTFTLPVTVANVNH